GAAPARDRHPVAAEHRRARLPDDRPRRRRRPEAPDAAAASLRHPLEQGRQRAAVRRTRADRDRAGDGRRRAPVLRARGRPPERSVPPRTLEELVALVRDAERAGTTIRMVGSGDSWSDAALTDGVLLEPEALSGLLELDDGTLRAGADAPRLVRVLAGTRL